MGIAAVGGDTGWCRRSAVWTDGLGDDVPAMKNGAIGCAVEVGQLLRTVTRVLLLSGGGGWRRDLYRRGH